MARKRPYVNVTPVADKYADKRNERIIEFSSPSGKGGLISFREKEDGTLTVDLYRMDEGITVQVEKDRLTAGTPRA